MMFLVNTDPLHLANELTGLVYTIIGILIVVVGGIVGTVKLFVAVKEQEKAMTKHIDWADRKFQECDQGVDEMCNKVEKQILDTNARISAQLNDCAKHKTETVKVAQIVKDLKAEMIGQVQRLHERLDMISENQHDLVLAMTTGQFHNTLKQMTVRRDSYDKKDRQMQQKIMQRTDNLKEDESNGI